MPSNLSFPAITPLFGHRNLSFGVIGLAGLHFILAAFGLPGWPCPFFQVLGVPCPGCGLTRATSFLIHGDVRSALTFHAFAPIFLVGISFAGITSVLPNTARNPLIDSVETVERRTGFTVILLVGLILYWLARLLLFPTDFVRLIRG